MCWIIPPEDACGECVCVCVCGVQAGFNYLVMQIWQKKKSHMAIIEHIRFNSNTGQFCGNATVTAWYVYVNSVLPGLLKRGICFNIILNKTGLSEWSRVPFFHPTVLLYFLYFYFFPPTFFRLLPWGSSRLLCPVRHLEETHRNISVKCAFLLTSVVLNCVQTHTREHKCARPES